MVKWKIQIDCGIYEACHVVWTYLFETTMLVFPHYFYDTTKRAQWLWLKKCHYIYVNLTRCKLIAIIAQFLWRREAGTKWPSFWQKTFWNGFSWKNLFVSWLNFLWSMFLGVQLRIIHLWLKYELHTNRRPDMTSLEIIDFIAKFHDNVKIAYSMVPRPV